jgi:hypothetical protein
MFKPLEKVWISSGNNVYPGVVLSSVGVMFNVLKFDTAIWRRVLCGASELSHRKQSFGDYMYKTRKNFIAA